MSYLSARDEQDGFIYWRSQCPIAIVKVLQSLQLVSILIFP